MYWSMLSHSTGQSRAYLVQQYLQVLMTLRVDDSNFAALEQTSSSSHWPKARGDAPSPCTVNADISVTAVILWCGVVITIGNSPSTSLRVQHLIVVWPEPILCVGVYRFKGIAYRSLIT